MNRMVLFFLLMLALLLTLPFAFTFVEEFVDAVQKWLGLRRRALRAKGPVARGATEAVLVPPQVVSRDLDQIRCPSSPHNPIVGQSSEDFGEDRRDIKSHLPPSYRY
jgi:hypothetical protein